MAVFVAAADESDGAKQTGPFVYGGFVAPTRDWIDWFAPAWEERVLNIDPPLTAFHMTTIRNPRWQAENGLTATNAERRIEEAVSVIASMGSIHLVRTSLDGGHFRQVFRETRMIRTTPQPGAHVFHPDYIGFLGFARGVLEYVHDTYPDAERIDFVVERKSKVSHHLPEYLNSLEQWCAKEEPHLVRLIGELIPGEKTRVPLQAADLAMWHVRRHEAGESEAIDIRRLRKMFEGRMMTLSGLTNDEVAGIGARSAARGVVSPFQPKAKVRRGGVS